MPPENLAGRTVASYRLLKRVGEGGTATVYRAEHAERGQCAVKVLRERSRKDPIAVKRFLREAGFGSRVEHDHVVRTYDYGEEDGLYYMALEWAEGKPLADFGGEESLSATDVAHVITQLADGLAAAHAVGIIHRDLKPENIIYDPRARIVKLLDFGIARDADDDPAERLTRTGFFVGSLNYVAPEALSGELVSEAADIYSSATIAYYLLSGEHPHNGKSPREVFQQLLTQPAKPLGETTRGARMAPAIADVIMKSLSRDPADRHPDVRAFAADLSTAASGAPSRVSAPPTGDEASGSGLFGSIRSIFSKKDRER
ncbi:MAG TPA: serine/threonine-protein kinase [Gemmatimonadales bacterium]